MTPKIKKIQYKKNYIYHIQFEDKSEGDVDFEQFLWGEVFDELKNVSYFKKASIDKIGGTISWPNGADVAPETLYKLISKNVTSSDTNYQLNN